MRRSILGRFPMMKLTLAGNPALFFRLGVAIVLGWLLAFGAKANEIQTPKVLLQGIHYDIALPNDYPNAHGLALTVGDQTYKPMGSGGEWVFANVVGRSTGHFAVTLIQDGVTVQTSDIPVIPAWISILPPLLAIGMALLTRSVLPALMLGLWLGAWALEGLTAKGAFVGLFASFEVYVTNAVANRDHVTIMLFTFMIAGMVGIISRNGGMRGIVELIIKGANSARRGQLAVWSLGLVIFFDDYSNTLVVGNTSRSITDKLRISREKLAYIVDSTAAPIATVALVTTWIGYQVSLIDDAVATVEGLSLSGYSIFLNSILYSFYPFMAMLLVVLVVTTGREFGPMLKAEQRARTTGVTAPPVTSAVGQDDEAALAMKPGLPPLSLIHI